MAMDKIDMEYRRQAFINIGFIASLFRRRHRALAGTVCQLQHV